MSGPIRSQAVALPRPGPAAPALPPTLGSRVLEGLRALPDNRWLDRLVRGRAWILVIAVALIGLVFMQVSMLKLDAGIGRAVERAGALERQNADLRVTVSRLSSEERIQRVAAEMGLFMPAAGDLRYVTSRGIREDARRAAKVMRAPAQPASQATAAPAPQAAAATTATATATAAAPAPATAAPAATAEPAAPPQQAPPSTAAQAPPAPAAPAAPAPQAQQQTAPQQPQPAPATPAGAAGTGATAAPVAGSGR